MWSNFFVPVWTAMDRCGQISQKQTLMENFTQEMCASCWLVLIHPHCLWCFDTIGWASEEHPACEKLSDETLQSLSVWSEVQMICTQSS